MSIHSFPQNVPDNHSSAPISHAQKSPKSPDNNGTKETKASKFANKQFSILNDAHSSLVSSKLIDKTISRLTAREKATTNLINQSASSILLNKSESNFSFADLDVKNLTIFLLKDIESKATSLKVSFEEFSALSPTDKLNLAFLDNKGILYTSKPLLDKFKDILPEHNEHAELDETEYSALLTHVESSLAEIVDKDLSNKKAIHQNANLAHIHRNTTSSAENRSTEATAAKDTDILRSNRLYQGFIISSDRAGFERRRKEEREREKEAIEKLKKDKYLKAEQLKEENKKRDHLAEDIKKSESKPNINDMNNFPS